MNFLRAHDMFLVDVIDFCIIDVRPSSAVRLIRTFTNYNEIDKETNKLK